MLPSWIPGSYLLREFARHVVAIEARDAAGPVAVEQVAKGTWVVADAADFVVVTIRIHAFDLSVRGAYFDRRRAFFNGTSVFLAPGGREDDACEVTIDAPAHAADWTVATAMRPDETDARGFGRYRAADYDELIDHPFEIGRHAVVEFAAAGVPHRFVIAGRFDADTDRLAGDLARLCTAQIDFFGRPAPFASYTFLGLATGDGYGGLEHRASSSLMFRRDDLPVPGAGVSRDYERLLGLVSHEYFHSWHIKRSKPAAFIPYRLDRRNQTRLLWVFEGITTYYQERFLRWSGLVGAEAHLRRLAGILTRVYRTPGRRRQSLEQSSFAAWDRLYKPDADSVNRDVSYYSKGAMLALALDLKLRAASPARSLDELVVAIWRRFGLHGEGLTEDGFEALAAELGGDAFARFVGEAVGGTDDPDLEALSRALGLELRFRPAGGAKDAGGTPPTGDEPRLTLGARIEADPAGIRLSSVLAGQPAEHAGLAPGDIIVAMDRIRTTADRLAERLARHRAGDEIEISYFRGDELANTRLRLAEAPQDTCYFVPDAGAGADAIARRDAWLGERL